MGNAGLLDEMLEPIAKAFSRDVAEAFANLKANEAVQARVAALAEKCNQGSLSSAERSEYESYVQAIDLISLLQAKARRWLARGGLS